jgi:hypothetical protein
LGGWEVGKRGSWADEKTSRGSEWRMILWLT